MSFKTGLGRPSPSLAGDREERPSAGGPNAVRVFLRLSGVQNTIKTKAIFVPERNVTFGFLLILVLPPYVVGVSESARLFILWKTLGSDKRVWLHKNEGRPADLPWIFRQYSAGEGMTGKHGAKGPDFVATSAPVEYS